MNENNETKVCNYCKTEIHKDASVCPQCRRGQNRGYMVATVLAIVLISFMLGRNAGRSSMAEEIMAAQTPVAIEMETTAEVEETVVEEVTVVTEETVVEQEVEVEDTTENAEKVEELVESEVQAATPEEMLEEMAEVYGESNLKAEYVYKGKKVTIAGIANNIDSNGISMSKTVNNKSCYVHCYFQNEEQIYNALNYKEGDFITITGVVTGTSSGYSVDIEQIHTN